MESETSRTKPPRERSWEVGLSCRLGNTDIRISGTEKAANRTWSQEHRKPEAKG